MFIITVVSIFLSIFVVNLLWLFDDVCISYGTMKASASSTALLLVIANLLDEYKFMGNSLSNGKFCSVVLALTFLWIVYYNILRTLLLFIEGLYNKYFGETS